MGHDYTTLRFPITVFAAQFALAARMAALTQLPLATCFARFTALEADAVSDSAT